VIVLDSRVVPQPDMKLGQEHSLPSTAPTYSALAELRLTGHLASCTCFCGGVRIQPDSKSGQ